MSFSISMMGSRPRATIIFGMPVISEAKSQTPYYATLKDLKTNKLVGMTDGDYFLLQKDGKFIEYTKNEKDPSVYIAISDAETGKVETLSEWKSFFDPVVTLTQDKNGNIVTSKENVFYELHEKDKDQLMRDVDAVKEYNDMQNSDNLHPKFSRLEPMTDLFPSRPERIPVAPELLRRKPELERLRGVPEIILPEPCGVVQKYQQPKDLGSIGPERIQEISSSLRPKRRK